MNNVNDPVDDLAFDFTAAGKLTGPELIGHFMKQVVEGTEGTPQERRDAALKACMGMFAAMVGMWCIETNKARWDQEFFSELGGDIRDITINSLEEWRNQ